MKRKRYQKIEVISEEDALTFQTKLNDVFRKLGDSNTKYTHSLYKDNNGFSAYVTYEEVEEIPECLMDEYHLKGIFPRCGDCEYYSAINHHEGECPYCKGILRRTDMVDTCHAYWTRLEDKERDGMYQNLRQEIKNQYGTIYKFSDAVGIDNSYVSSMLNGRYPFSASNQLKILKALGIEISEENIMKYFPEGNYEH